MYRRTTFCCRASIPAQSTNFPKRIEQRMIVLPRWKYAKTKVTAPPPPGVKQIEEKHKDFYGDELEEDEETLKKTNKFEHMNDAVWGDRHWKKANRLTLTDTNPLESEFDRDFAKLMLPQPQQCDTYSRLETRSQVDRSKANLFDDSRVIITPGEPTMMFDLGAEAAAEDNKNVKMEMEEFRRQLKPANWKRFMQLMDAKVNEDMRGFDLWAQDKTLQEIYVGLMKEDKRKKRKGFLRKIRWYCVVVVGSYSACCGYGWHFFELY